MRNLGRSDSRFTLRERKRYTDLRGLRKSDYTGAHHSLGAYAYGGYASVVSNSSVINPHPGGYNLRFGGLYEYRFGYFTVQTGVTVVRSVSSTFRTLIRVSTEWSLLWLSSSPFCARRIA